MRSGVHSRRGAASSPNPRDRKSTRLNSSHDQISYAVFCLKKKNIDSAELAFDLLKHFANLLTIGDVHLDRHRSPPHLAAILARLISVHPTLVRGVLAKP